jgi:hypothetical protein
MRSWGRLVGATLAIAALPIAGGGALAADAASTPAGGTVQLIAQPTSSGKGTIIFTGAIGDSGKTLTVAKNGKPQSGGDYSKVSLSKGTLTINQTAFQNAASAASPVIDEATCSASLKIAAAVTLTGGTGLYRGISGSVNLTEWYDFVAPRFTSGKKKGQCDFVTTPAAQSGLIEGSGKVKFG